MIKSSVGTSLDESKKENIYVYDEISNFLCYVIFLTRYGIFRLVSFTFSPHATFSTFNSSSQGSCFGIFFDSIQSLMFDWLRKIFTNASGFVLIRCNLILVGGSSDFYTSVYPCFLHFSFYLTFKSSSVFIQTSSLRNFYWRWLQSPWITFLVCTMLREANT